MYSINLLNVEHDPKKSLENVKKNKLIPYPAFLVHFYNILDSYLNQEEAEINKIFNLYVVRLKQNKEEVDRFRQLYIDSFSEYCKQDNEISFIMNFLKKNDRESCFFIYKAKQKILSFYDISENKMGTQLNTSTIKIGDWINLLKSFPFFTNENLLGKIERFKKHISDENESILEISGLEFLRSTYNFYVAENHQEEVVKKRFKTTNYTHVSRRDKEEDYFFTDRKQQNKLLMANTAVKVDKGVSTMNNDTNDIHSKINRPKRA